jgi:hypothetical protein
MQRSDDSELATSGNFGRLLNQSPQCLKSLWPTILGARRPASSTQRVFRVPHAEEHGLGLAGMPHYYFDIRENDEVTVDELGMQLPDLQAAAVESAKSLADLAKDLLPAARCYSLGIEVRNHDEPLFKIAIAYEFKRH